jgi:uncharacterized protein YdeI (YjbR/CyaY-like superfamily)
VNTTSVDSYLTDGCGRCPRYQTPQCKVHTWADGLELLRQTLRESDLTEEMKWGSPCYTLEGKNVVMLMAFNASFALSFMKGILLTDPEGMLERPGPNTHAGRLLRFTSMEDLRARRELAADFIRQAVALQRSGAVVPARQHAQELPEELQEVLDADARVQAAFAALTPGRRRSYILHVSGAKQSKTRSARSARCIPKILAGKGFNER